MKVLLWNSSINRLIKNPFLLFECLSSVKKNLIIDTKHHFKHVYSSTEEKLSCNCDCHQISALGFTQSKGVLLVVSSLCLDHYSPLPKEVYYLRATEMEGLAGLISASGRDLVADPAPSRVSEAPELLFLSTATCITAATTFIKRRRVMY